MCKEFFNPLLELQMANQKSTAAVMEAVAKTASTAVKRSGSADSQQVRQVQPVHSLNKTFNTGQIQDSDRDMKRQLRKFDYA